MSRILSTFFIKNNVQTLNVGLLKSSIHTQPIKILTPYLIG
jgi:hypothetical protein